MKLRVASIMPVLGIVGAARVMEAAVSKWGVLDWRARPRPAADHVDAIIRHSYRLLAGEICDPETGLTHWSHIAARGLVAEEQHRLGLLDYTCALPLRLREEMTKELNGNE